MNLRMTLVLCAAALCAQNKPAFDVATVKASESFEAQGAIRIGTTAAHGELRMAGSTLRNLIRWAYSVRSNQVIGPAWIDSEHYDVVAKGAADSAEDQLRLMLRALLEERFKLALHRETRELPSYILAVGKNGAKLHTAEGDGPSRFFPGRAGVSAQHVTLDRFAELLANRLDRPVVNATTLTGVYDIDLKWTPDAAAASDDPGPSVFTAIQEQLGLRLEAKKTPTDVLVIDRAEKIPIQN
jgi:uncharacterized protein (TIGR03435 family)